MSRRKSAERALRPPARRGWSDSNAELLARARSSRGAGLQYWKDDVHDLEIVQTTRPGPAADVQARLLANKRDDFSDTLRAVAHALVVRKSCDGNGANRRYVYETMILECTHVVVAFRENEPVGFALLDKSHAKQTEVAMLCAAASARGTGRVLLHTVTEEARAARRTVTLSALPSIMSYYAANGFALGEKCGRPPQLVHGNLVTTRLKHGKNGRYDFAPIAPLITELHRKKLAPRSTGICGKSNATFSQLEKGQCMLDGYRMHKCPTQPGAAPQREARVASQAAASHSARAKAKAARAEAARAEAVRAEAARVEAERAKVERAKAAKAEAERAKAAKAAVQKAKAVTEKAATKRAHVGRHTSRPRFVSTKRELLAMADGTDARWRRRSRDGTTAVLSRAQVLAELAQKQAARQRRNAQKKTRA